MTPHGHSILSHDSQTSQFYASNLMRSSEGPNGVPFEDQNSYQENPKKNSFDALLMTNSSLSFEYLDDIQTKDIDEETMKLCKFFKGNKYPTKEEMKELGQLTNRTVRHLETWFKNRRRALALKGLLPNYQRKNKFSKQEIEILKDFFNGVKKPKKYHFEQIHQKLNKECSIKNIKNWFNHYKKKVKLGLQERKKKPQTDFQSNYNSNEITQNTQDNGNGNSSSIGTQQPLQKQDFSQDFNSNYNANNFVANPIQNFTLQAIPLQNPQKNNNNLLIVPLMQPYAVIQKTSNGPVIMQNYCLASQNNLFPNMGYNLVGQNNNMNQMPMESYGRFPQQNSGYFLIVNQPYAQTQAAMPNMNMNMFRQNMNECRSFEQQRGTA